MRFSSLQSKIGHAAVKTPDKIAIEYGDTNITYLELERSSNQYANFFYPRIKEDKNVFVLMDRCPELIETIIGIIKAGGVFSPVDPNLPENRVRMMMDIVKPKWVVTQSKWLNKLDNIIGGSSEAINALVVDSDDEALADGKSFNVYKLDKDISFDSLAINDDIINKHCYIYFTSGSTGKPKGVLGRHRSLSHFIEWEIEEFRVDGSFKVSQLTPASFDPFLRDVFVPLCAGGTLCIPHSEEIILNPRLLVKWIDDRSISLMHIVPSLFRRVANEVEGSECLKELKYILLAGEMLRGNDIKKFLQIFKSNIQLVNLYGPTETTLAKTYYRISEEDIEKASVPVGRPINNTEVLILNADLKKCLTESIGEIYIRTPYISSGYYNDKDLSRKVFIKNPFNNNPQDIIYKTGDLGRILDDGNIEILGRIDHQVKIRGFRIELSEIENALLNYNGIRESAVIAREDESENKYLCAYIVGDKAITASKLREHLSKELPDYMIPSYFIQLEKLPLTPNGKVDRNALPEPGEGIVGRPEYEAPGNETEEKLAKLWSAVLEISKIGINDNFFELGGHSLKAADFVSKCHKILNVELPLGKLFEAPTIKELAQHIRALDRCNYIEIPKTEDRRCYPLSAAQRRIYTLQQLEIQGTGYNIPKVLEVEGKLDKGRLEEGFRKLIKRHESIRTSFEVIKEEIVQKVHEEVEFEIDYKEAEESDNELSAEAIEGIIKEFIKPFDLKKAPLLRVGLIKVHPQRHILMFDMHHIISDGISMGILTKEFVKAYEEDELAELRIQYKDYAAWQNELFKNGEIKKQEEYWMDNLKGEIPVLNMMTDYPRPSIQSFEGERISFEIDRETTKELNKLCKETGTTMYMVLLSAYNILLSKYSGQEDIIVGSPIAGRSHADLENIIGMFVNTLAMRNYPEGDKTFKELLGEVKTSALKAYENQDYQFEELVEKLDLRRDLSRNPLFDTMLVMQNIDMGGLEIRGLSFRPYEYESKVTKFDLTLTAVEKEERIRMHIEYSTRLYKKETIERLERHYKNIIKEIIESPDKKLKEIELLSEEEKRQLLIEFNDTKVEYPKEKTIQELFEEQAERTPDNIAVVFEDNKLTYRELNERANSLAKVLREKGVGADSIVGIMVERSLEMIVGIIGILKAGGAYLPIDPEYPKDRIEYMLSDSSTSILLTQKRLKDRVEFSGELIDLEDESIYRVDGSDIERAARQNSLAYVIYTSGTTGRPKGVMIEHRNIINTILWRSKEYKLTKEDRVLQLFSFAFDGFITSFFTPIVSGASIVLMRSGEEKDPVSIKECILENRITHFITVPTLFSAILDCLNDNNVALHTVTLAGERVTDNIIQYSKRKIGKVKIYNEYGPTENSVLTTISKDIDIDKPITIGKPIANTRIYIVDKYNNLQPVGIAGELCISGVGLARGYINRLELTEEKFIENPFEPGERMYKTGDLARWLPDGNIEFLGRVDHQVKIRGFRIELGEIENRLRSYECVKEAVAAAMDDDGGGKYLCAYISVDRDIAVTELREYLSSELPDYMIPSYFMQLEKLPLTVNGKIDYKALPKPDGNIISGAEYEAPRNNIEEALAKIWSEVLGVEKIGINDNFFDLGGDSIKAIQVSARLNKYKLRLEIRDLFQNPTIKALSSYIKAVERKSQQAIVEGEVMLTPIQRWFFDERFEGMYHWNQSIMLYKANGFNEAAVIRTFNKILEHHDGLRMVYVTDEGKITQFNRGIDGELFTFKAVELTGDADYIARIEAEANSLQDSIDLKSGPLVKLALFKTSRGDHLLIIIHHLVVDGVSWRILLEDFANGYEKALNGEEVEFREKTDSIKEWAKQLEVYASSKELLQEIKYWRNITETEVNPLPKDYIIHDNKVKDSTALNIDLSVEDTHNLLKAASRAYNTEINDILLTALGITIKNWTMEHNVFISLEGHGRERIADEINIDRTVGWFTSTYPIILDMTKSEDISYVIKNTKETLRHIPNKGVGYGVLKYLTPPMYKQSINFNIMPEIIFNYLGQFDSDINTDIFSISDIKPGYNRSLNSKRPYVIDINAMVVNEQFRLTFSYNKLQYKEATMLKLINSYKENLIKIIYHCITKEEIELTPTDLGDGELSIDEFDTIRELINQIGED